jgi:hypothetical protein
MPAICRGSRLPARLCKPVLRFGYILLPLAWPVQELSRRKFGKIGSQRTIA